MARTFQLVVPTVAETRLTGLIAAAERTIRKRLRRVEHRYDQPASYLCDGVAVAPDVAAANPAVMRLHEDSWGTEEVSA